MHSRCSGRAQECVSSRVAAHTRILSAPPPALSALTLLLLSLLPLSLLVLWSAGAAPVQLAYAATYWIVAFASATLMRLQIGWAHTDEGDEPQQQQQAAEGQPAPAELTAEQPQPSPTLPSEKQREEAGEVGELKHA